jgi:hypothetical protein
MAVSVECWFELTAFGEGRALLVRTIFPAVRHLGAANKKVG